MRCGLPDGCDRNNSVTTSVKLGVLCDGFTQNPALVLPAGDIQEVAFHRAHLDSFGCFGMRCPFPLRLLACV
jgi:hypothetical protein